MTLIEPAEALLFRLPPEIRNQIYSHVFLGTSDPPAVFTLTRQHLRPPVLSVNRRLRAEAAGFFYSSTIFLVKSHDLCVDWLCGLPIEYRHHIREIRLDATAALKHTTTWNPTVHHRPDQHAERRLTALQQDLASKAILLDEGILKTNVTINGRTVWTSEPIITSMSSEADGAFLGPVTFA